MSEKDRIRTSEQLIFENSVATEVPCTHKKKSRKPRARGWLCSPGRYGDYIQASSDLSPELMSADPANTRSGTIVNRGNARVVLLESPAAGPPCFNSTLFANSEGLRKHFDDISTDKRAFRRVYIMEGLCPQFISALGGHFFMDPAFFMRHERTCVWSSEFTPATDALPLPSMLNPDESFYLRYCELRQFNHAIEDGFYTCLHTKRHVGIMRPRKDEGTATGILRRKASWWSRPTNDGGWDAVILCDPQLKSLSPSPKVFSADTPPPFCTLEPGRDIRNYPFRGGYAHFIPTCRSHVTDPGRPKHYHLSMLDDLVFYFQNFAYQITADEWADPKSSSIFLQKIVASHYHQLVDYLKAMIPSLELRLSSGSHEEHDYWQSLKTVYRRCDLYEDEVKENLISLGHDLDDPDGNRTRDWKNCEKDFRYIGEQFWNLKTRANYFMDITTGSSALSCHRQNLESNKDAKHIKHLNRLALFFLPLAYTSSIFSMQDNFAPGSSKFWIYWVCAAGSVVLTLLTTWFLDRVQVLTSGDRKNAGVSWYHTLWLYSYWVEKREEYRERREERAARCGYNSDT